jgi:hypothetical protein
MHQLLPPRRRRCKMTGICSSESFSGSPSAPLAGSARSGSPQIPVPKGHPPSLKGRPISRSLLVGQVPLLAPCRGAAPGSRPQVSPEIGSGAPEGGCRGFSRMAGYAALIGFRLARRPTRCGIDPMRSPKATRRLVAAPY